MRDFLNRKEIELTGVSFAAKEYLKIYLGCEYLNEEEKKLLTNAIRNLDKLQDSILGRTDVVYLKRLKNLLDNNELYFYPKNLNRTKIIEEVDDSVIEKLISDSSWAMDCIGCENEDYKNCECYKIMASLGKQPTNYNGGCPFK